MTAQPDIFMDTAGHSRAALATDRVTCHAYVANLPREFRAGFQAYLADNWELWCAFVRYSDRMRSRRSHYSADAILHAIRFESDLAEVRSPYKVNNNWSADFGRLYNAAAGVDFFRLRERSAAGGIEPCAA